MRKAQAEVQNQPNIQNCKLLPPKWQIKREIEAIQNDPRLKEFLGNEAEKIIDIKKVDHGFYVVSTENLLLLVEVEYLPNDCCGPAKFQLNFNHLPFPQPSAEG